MTGTTGATTEGRSWRILAGIGGIAFAVLFVAGWIVGIDTPEYDAGDQAWIDWFDDSGNRAQQVFSSLTLTMASLLFLVFLSGLVHLVRRSVSGVDGPALLAMGAGVVFATATTVSGLTVGAVSNAIEFAPQDFPIPSADVLRMTEQLGIGIGLVAGGWAAALFVAAASLSARRAEVLPGWLTIAGYVVAALLVLSFFFVPLILLPVWVVLVSVTMLGSRAP